MLCVSGRAGGALAPVPSGPRRMPRAAVRELILSLRDVIFAKKTGVLGALQGALQGAAARAGHAQLQHGNSAAEGLETSLLFSR